MQEFFEYIYEHDMYREDNTSEFLKPKHWLFLRHFNR